MDLKRFSRDDVHLNPKFTSAGVWDPPYSVLGLRQRLDWYLAEDQAISKITSSFDKRISFYFLYNHEAYVQKLKDIDKEKRKIKGRYVDADLALCLIAHATSVVFQASGEY